MKRFQKFALSAAVVLGLALVSAPLTAEAKNNGSGGSKSFNCSKSFCHSSCHNYCNNYCGNYCWDYCYPNYCYPTFCSSYCLPTYCEPVIVKKVIVEPQLVYQPTYCTPLCYTSSYCSNYCSSYYPFCDSWKSCFQNKGSNLMHSSSFHKSK